MRNIVLPVLFAGIMLAGPSGLTAVEADTKGATPGKWTMDLDAAKIVAIEKNLPILLNFTGSDWCGWCKLMEKNVFSTQEWQDYAKDNIMMVLIDFPKSKSIVPEEYVERNEKLKASYDVNGFPTFVILNDDAETTLGKLGAGKEKTPAIFIQELTDLFRYRAAEVAKYTNTLDAEKKALYLSIVEQISESNKAIKRYEQQITDAELGIKDTEQKLADQQESAQAFRAAQLGEEQLTQYKSLKSELETAKKALAEWMSSEPPRNEENMKKFQSLSAAIQEISGKLSKY